MYARGRETGYDSALSRFQVFLRFIFHSARFTPTRSQAALNLALVITLNVVIDFVYKVAVISLFYYFIYLFPATVFCIVVVIGELADGVEHWTQSVILMGYGVLGLVAYTVYPRWAPLILRLDRRWLAVLALLAVSGAAFLNRHS